MTNPSGESSEPARRLATTGPSFPPDCPAPAAGPAPRRASRRTYWGNFEGALPLLLVGSALLVYAAILAGQEAGIRTTHLPLWDLFAGVGAVIVGAGIYSTLLPVESPPLVEESADWVMVPRAEWEAVRPGRRPAERPARRARPPVWWEGPSAESPTEPTVRATTFPPPRSPEPSPPPSPPPPRTVRAVDGPPSRPRARPARPSPVPESAGAEVVRPPPVRRVTPTSELEEALAELESLVQKQGPPSSRAARAKPVPGEAPWCADCGRRLAREPAPNHCSGCGRELCPDCSLSSQYEDADLRCIECRAHLS